MYATSLAVVGCLLLACLSPPVVAEEPLVSNRPGFSNTWEIVQSGRVELNAGVGYVRVDEEEALALGQVLVRFGLSERLEFRAGLNSYVDVDGPGGAISGFEDPTLGIKVRVLEGDDGTRPQAAFILQSTVPIGGDEIGVPEPQPAGIVVLSWNLGPRLHLDTNHGVSYLDDGVDRWTEFLTSYGLAVTVAGDLGLYFEYAGFFPLESGRDEAHFLFAALTYLTSNRMQVDLGVGRGLNREDPDHFVSAGVAYRW